MGSCQLPARASLLWSFAGQNASHFGGVAGHCPRVHDRLFQQAFSVIVELPRQFYYSAFLRDVQYFFV